MHNTHQNEVKVRSTSSESERTTKSSAINDAVRKLVVKQSQVNADAAAAAKRRRTSTG